MLCLRCSARFAEIPRRAAIQLLEQSSGTKCPLEKPTAPLQWI